MARRERGLFQIIWRNFKESLRPAQGPKLIGEDYYGTKYYETPLKNQTVFKKAHRHFEPVNKDNFRQEIPAEWEAWLRYRRQEAPTQEEIKMNYQIMMTTKKNAAEVDAKYLAIKAERGEIIESKAPEKLGSYPVYEEYKNYGANYEVKIKKKGE